MASIFLLLADIKSKIMLIASVQSFLETDDMYVNIVL